MSMMKNFDEEFVLRTKLIVEELDSDDYAYNVTLLLNCLMGLLSLPIEKKKDNTSQRSLVFKANCVSEAKAIGAEVRVGDQLNNHLFFRKIRNSIAHFNIQLIDNGFGNIGGVVLRDRRNSTAPFDFEIVFSVEQLKLFALYVADQYLRNYFHTESEVKQDGNQSSKR